MRAFKIAVAIMLSILVFSVPMSYYISATLGDMCRQIEELPEKPDAEHLEPALERIEALSRKWRENKKIFELTIPYYEIHRAEVELHNIKAYFSGASNSSYSAARLRLLSAMEALHGTESISWENIM